VEKYSQAANARQSATPRMRPVFVIQVRT